MFEKIHEKYEDIRRIKNAYIFYVKRKFNKGRIAGQADRQKIVSKVIKPDFDFRRLMLACLALSSIVPVLMIVASPTRMADTIFVEIGLLLLAGYAYKESKIKLGEE